MSARTKHCRGKFSRGIRKRMEMRMISQALGAHLTRDIGFDAAPGLPCIPPFAALITRV